MDPDAVFEGRRLRAGLDDDTEGIGISCESEWEAPASRGRSTKDEPEAMAVGD